MNSFKLFLSAYWVKFPEQSQHRLVQRQGVSKLCSHVADTTVLPPRAAGREDGRRLPLCAHLGGEH